VLLRRHVISLPANRYQHVFPASPTPSPITPSTPWIVILHSVRTLPSAPVLLARDGPHEREDQFPPWGLGELFFFCFSFGLSCSCSDYRKDCSSEAIPGGLVKDLNYSHEIPEATWRGSSATLLSCSVAWTTPRRASRAGAKCRRQARPNMNN
jgi:hypothetical protein